MSISALGAASGSPGATYDFTNVTNAQFEQEVQSLGQNGKLSNNQEMRLTLAADGGDSVPINGPHPTTTQVLSDATLRNFITEIQGDDNSAHAPGAVGGALYDSVLQALEQNQGRPIEASSASVSKTV